MPRCTATTKTGEPCQNFAMKGSDRCRSHRADLPAPQSGAPEGNRNRLLHGLYAKYLTDDDLAALATVGADPGLADEIAFTRVVIRRLAELIGEAGSIEQAVSLSSALFTGAGRVAMLLKTQHAISGAAADGLNAAIGHALSELSTIWGTDL